MNLEKYLITENNETKLWNRYIKVLNTSIKIHNKVNSLDTELSRIQKAMKKEGIKELKNPNGHTVFDVNEDTGNRAWSMVRG